MLVVRGSSEFLYSKEGVTQGDPLSMFMYAIGTLPLIHLYDHVTSCDHISDITNISYTIKMYSFHHKHPI